MEDQQIIDLFFAREEQAISETQQKYGKLCHSVAKNILGSQEDAQECVNDTYLAAWNAIPPTRPRYFGAFLCKITRNLSLKKLEHQNAAKRQAGKVVPIDEIETLLPDDRLRPHVGEVELSELLNTFLRGEKEMSRNVFLRRYWFFDSIEEIAGRYGFSQSKVKSMLFHSRNRLRDFLKREGVEI